MQSIVYSNRSHRKIMALGNSTVATAQCEPGLTRPDRTRPDRNPHMSPMHRCIDPIRFLRSVDGQSVLTYLICKMASSRGCAEL